MIKKLILVASTAQLLFAVSAIPTPITLTQPDGSTFSAFLRGDERAAWFETTDGFSIVENAGQEWVFATGIAGTVLAPGNERVSTDNSVPTSRSTEIPRHLKPEPKIVIDNYPKLNLHATAGDTFFIPMILIEYPDMAHQYSDSTLNNVLNQEGYSHLTNTGSGSFLDFYHEISYGQFTPIHHVMHWITAPYNHDYYAYSDGYDHVLDLVRTAVDSMEAQGVDWSIYDNDNDGTLDALNLIHAGLGAEEGDLSNIWSHKWYLSAAGLQVTYDGILIDGYSMNPEIQNNNIVAIGVIAHEFGHALGLPDLYDTDYSSSGAGKLALMASGSWGTSGNTPWYPSAMNAWSKAELGWVNTITLATDQTDIEMVQSYSNNNIYRIDHTQDDSEYWLIENRQKVGTDQKMPQGGLLLWHIDMEKTSGWAVNDDEPHYGVGLEQADGLFSLENNGYSDGGDPYPGSTLNRAFTNQTKPSSVSYYDVPSMIAIEQISDPDSIMTFDLTFNEILMAGIALSEGISFAYDYGTTSLALTNDMPVNEFYFELDAIPGILSIEGADLLGSVTADSIIIAGTRVELVNPAIPANAGSFLSLDLFANTGVAKTVSLTLDNYFAGDSSGNEIALMITDAAYNVYGRYQTFTISADSAAAGGAFQYRISLANNVPLRMISITIAADPTSLVVADEPYTDANSNAQWDADEVFTDWNQDGEWTPAVQFGERLTGWNTSAIVIDQSLLIQTSSWIDTLQIGAGTMFTVNGLVSGDATAGPVSLTSSNVVLMDVYGNIGVLYEGLAGTIQITPAVSTEPLAGLPTSYGLTANYPNPFNPTTSLDYQIPEQALVSFTIYDIRGTLVYQVQQKHSPGKYTMQWDGLNNNGIPVSSGTYFIRMEAPGYNRTNKVLLLK